MTRTDTVIYGIISGICLVLGCLMKLKKFIQCYYFDKKCTSFPDLNKYYVVVTGGNSGIGFATAIELAKCGANVILACRSMVRGQTALDEIKKKSNSTKVSLMQLDLSELSSVKSFISEFKKKKIPLNILINNAGLAAQSFELTSDNYELTWQTNYLSSFLLTNELLPILRASGKGNANKSRIVFVSSGAHKRSYINWDDINYKNEYSRGKAYGQSKLAQILYAKELARREMDIITTSCTPGFVRTNIFSSHMDLKKKILKFIFYPIIWFVSRSSKAGAQVVLHCALSNNINNGSYYSNCYEKSAEGKDGIANSKEVSKRLWDLSEKMVSEYQERKTKKKVKLHV